MPTKRKLVARRLHYRINDCLLLLALQPVRSDWPNHAEKVALGLLVEPIKNALLATLECRPCGLELLGGNLAVVHVCNEGVEVLDRHGSASAITFLRLRLDVPVAAKTLDRKIDRRRLCLLERRVSRTVDVPLPALVRLDRAVVHRPALRRHVVGVLEELQHHALHVVTLPKVLPRHQVACLAGRHAVVGFFAGRFV